MKLTKFTVFPALALLVEATNVSAKTVELMPKINSAHKSDAQMQCQSDIKQCPDGQTLNRNPTDNCKFLITWCSLRCNFDAHHPVCYRLYLLPICYQSPQRTQAISLFVRARKTAPARLLAAMRTISFVKNQSSTAMVSTIANLNIVMTLAASSRTTVSALHHTCMCMLHVIPALALLAARITCPAPDIIHRNLIRRRVGAVGFMIPLGSWHLSVPLLGSTWSCNSLIKLSELRSREYEA